MEYGAAYTADFIKKVLSVYTHSMATIYLSLGAQVAKSTFFMKPPIWQTTAAPDIVRVTRELSFGTLPLK